MSVLIELFLTFARIGLFTFGGGYAMIAMIEHHCVERRGWITHDELMDVTVIAESTPGPIAINCATFTGYRRAGLPGAIVATLGMIVPSFVIILLLSLLPAHLLEVTIIAHAFRGIKIAVGLLILDAAITMLRKMPKRWLPRTIMVCACLAMLCIDVFAVRFSSIGLMLIAAMVSLAVYAIGRARGQRGGGGR